MNIYTVVDDFTMGGKASNLDYDYNTNICRGVPEKPEPGKPVKQKNMQNHDVQLSPKKGEKHSFVDGYHHIVVNPRVRRLFASTQLRQQRNKKVVLQDVGEYKEVENRGVFYQYKQNQKNKGIMKGLSVIYDSILNSTAETAPQETTIIQWEHNPVRQTLRSSVFMKKGAYREPSEVSSIYHGGSTNSDCSLEESHMLPTNYDVQVCNRTLLAQIFQ